jgi:23S rRNA (pseudouridine1915-N3)-methyltransferase
MLKIIAVGKNIAFLKEAEAEYMKRLGFYSKVVLVEVKEASGSPEEVKKKEAERLLEKAGDDFFALDERGAAHSTADLKTLVEKNKDLVFVIGGAFGLDESVKKKAKKMFSLSSLTFTHQLARILLLEQLYRANTIIKGHPYSK